MSTFPQKILLATDGSEDAEIAARAAIELARETGAQLHVVHVGQTLEHLPAARIAGPPPPTATPEELTHEAQRVLDREVKR